MEHVLHKKSINNRVHSKYGTYIFGQYNQPAFIKHLDGRKYKGMHAHLAGNDRDLFYSYLNMAKVYFEYGSGGSTFQASIRNNITKIYTVESDLLWHSKSQDLIKNKNHISFIYNEMDVRPRTWGNPGPMSTKDQWINYSNQLTIVDNPEKIDLILIDGRFRVACCLKCFNIINENCIIVFDDFMNRSYYQIILKFYNIIKHTSSRRMVILKKRLDVNVVPDDLIKKYELIKD